MITEMTEINARQFLEDNVIGHLGCLLDPDQPYVVPVTYFMKNGTIYVHSLPGLKLDAMRANPKVCFEVTESWRRFEWKSVVAFGEFEEVTDANERAEILTEMFERFQRLTPVEAISMASKDDLPMIVFRINIKNITGRAES